ncbi:MAG TPA: hypothetical protein VJA23_01265 [Candidatus Nanoarchaeia archaeon]|nr:hypothetical protein [Candidatus Nanoarchaeia archaeon]
MDVIQKFCVAADIFYAEIEKALPGSLVLTNSIAKNKRLENEKAQARVTLDAIKNSWKSAQKMMIILRYGVKKQADLELRKNCLSRMEDLEKIITKKYLDYTAFLEWIIKRVRTDVPWRKSWDNLHPTVLRDIVSLLKDLMSLGKSGTAGVFSVGEQAQLHQKQEKMESINGIIISRLRR